MNHEPENQKIPIVHFSRLNLAVGVVEVVGVVEAVRVVLVVEVTRVV